MLSPFLENSQIRYFCFLLFQLKIYIANENFVFLQVYPVKNDIFRSDAETCRQTLLTL